MSTQETHTDPATLSAPSISNLISAYGILQNLAEWVSAVDLYHLGLTNRYHHSLILASPVLFKKLQRLCLCDGRGLLLRQEFLHPYALRRDVGRLSINPHMDGDAEIEVRLYNIRCDEAGALPCIKCGINVCEECRYYPRAAPPMSYPRRRPHLNGAGQFENIMCLCPPCDAEMEKELAGKFLNELCDCDLYTRWICTRCDEKVDEFTMDYFNNHTMFEDDGGNGPTKSLIDHAFDRYVWCLCGDKIPEDGPVRCTWCKRRHLPEAEWGREMREVGSRLPFFDNDPNYPRWVMDEKRKYPTPYPRLGYVRPGDEFPA